MGLNFAVTHPFLDLHRQLIRALSESAILFMRILTKLRLAIHRWLLWTCVALPCASARTLQAQNFVLTGSMGTARTSHTATVLPNGQVLVAGGCCGPTGYGVESAEVFDPITGSWTPTGNLNVSRSEHAAVLLTNGKVLVVGGRNGFGLVAGSELYDPATQAWSTNGSLGSTRFRFTATRLLNGKVLVAGGGKNSAELYDPATEQWTPTNPMTSERDGHTATLLPSGQVLVVGGYRPSTPYYLASAERYDPATEKWAATSSLSTPRSDHQSILLKTGQVLVWNGTSNGSTYFTTAELYDAGSAAWSSVNGFNAGLNTFLSSPITLLPDGRVLATGGFNFFTGAGALFFDDAFAYNPTASTWSTNGLGRLNTPRSGHTSSLLANGQVLITGGKGKKGNLADAELFGTPQPTDSNLLLTHPEILANGTFQFIYTDRVGQGLVVFSTSNLAIPISKWEVIGEADETTPGHYQFADPRPAQDGARFYRVGSL